VRYKYSWIADEMGDQNFSMVRQAIGRGSSLPGKAVLASARPFPGLGQPFRDILIDAARNMAFAAPWAAAGQFDAYRYSV
jgi:hypothetical protein